MSIRIRLLPHFFFSSFSFVGNHVPIATNLPIRGHETILGIPRWVFDQHAVLESQKRLFAMRDHSSFQLHTFQRSEKGKEREREEGKIPPFSPFSSHKLNFSPHGISEE